MKKTIDTITARQRSRHYVNGRVEFDLPGRITNASQRETYKPAPEWQRNDGHKRRVLSGHCGNANEEDDIHGATSTPEPDCFLSAIRSYSEG